MDVRKLEYLRWVVETGSYAEAARRAGVSQPAVTQAIQALEREWGVALFSRSGRGKVPTRAGLVAARRAIDVLDRLDAMRRAPASGTRDPDPEPPSQDLLRAGMGAAAVLMFGPTLARSWQLQRPDGLLRIVGGSSPALLAGLRDGDLDLVVSPRPRGYDPKGLRRSVLYASSPVVYARIGHPMAGARSLAEIRDARWVVEGRAGTPGNVIEEALRVRRLPPPTIAVQCPDFRGLVTLVGATDLLCVIPHPALLTADAHETIAPLAIREGLPRYEICLFRRRDGDAERLAIVESITEAMVAEAHRRGTLPLRRAASLSRDGHGVHAGGASSDRSIDSDRFSIRRPPATTGRPRKR